MKTKKKGGIRKLLMTLLIWICMLAPLTSIVFAEDTPQDQSSKADKAKIERTSRGDLYTTPSEIFDDLMKWSKTQDTALDNVDPKEWRFDSQYVIANTLDSLRKNIYPYMQWILYIWLAAATILIIITGWQLVVSLQSGYDTKKAIERLKNIGIWVWVLTGFYFILRIFMAVLTYFLQ